MLTLLPINLFKVISRFVLCHSLVSRRWSRIAVVFQLEGAASACQVQRVLLAILAAEPTCPGPARITRPVQEGLLRWSYFVLLLLEINVYLVDHIMERVRLLLLLHVLFSLLTPVLDVSLDLGNVDPMLIHLWQWLLGCWWDVSSRSALMDIGTSAIFAVIWTTRYHFWYAILICFRNRTIPLPKRLIRSLHFQYPRRIPLDHLLDLHILLKSSSTLDEIQTLLDLREHTLLLLRLISRLTIGIILDVVQIFLIAYVSTLAPVFRLLVLALQQRRRAFEQHFRIDVLRMPFVF